MPIKITPELLRDYANKQLRHDAYVMTSTLYEDLRVHADGEVPIELIECRRPSESEEIKEYRIKIYQPTTKPTFTKVISSLAKIRRSPDWAIKFDNKKVSTIASDETFEEYVTKNFPLGFDSITNWVFSVCLKNYLLDANAVVLVIPSNINKVDIADYYTPFPYIFNSPLVLAFAENDYCVLLSEEKCRYGVVDSGGNLVSYNEGVILHVVDREYVRTFEQSDTSYGMVETVRYEHKLGYMPAFKMSGSFFKTCGGQFIFESRISGMLPDLNEAARMYSDLQAEIVQHVHSEKWLYQNLDCNNCHGTGQEQVNEQRIDTCHVCKGFGKVSTSPYDNHVIKSPEIGELAIPTPPAGYIQKTDVAMMVEKQNTMYNEKLYNALASVNMQFLSTVPQAQSGIAKEVDKDELNNLVHLIAEDLVKIMDRYMKIAADMRYMEVVADRAKRIALCPSIPVPAVFDLLSANFLAEEIKTAKESNLDTLIIMALQTEYAAKKFYNNPEVAQLLALSYTLDPMPGISDDQKALRLQNDGVTQEDYVISCNMVPFLKRAIFENPKFVGLDYTEQMKILTQYAKEKVPTAAAKVQPEPDEVLDEVIE